jgi:hypothetical protein
MSEPATNSTRRFTPTALFLCGGLLIWATDFLIVYVLAAIACAKPHIGGSFAGIPFVALVGTAVTLIAAVATVILVRIALRRLRAEGRTPSGFIYFLTTSIGAIALLAMFFNVLPAWLLAAECSGR